MDAVKLVDADKGIVEGYAIPFGGPLLGGKDLDGEAFSKNTELYLDAYDRRPVLYFHGMDKTVGPGPIGAEVKWDQRDGGIWLEAQLDMGAKYQEHILELARRGLLGYSTGANPLSVVKSASGLIERWMWNETSLAPVPSNPFAMVALKALGPNEEIPVSDQAQLCETLGHFPDAGEVATWLVEHGKSKKAAFSDEMLERFVRLELMTGEMSSAVSEMKWQLDTVRRAVNPDEFKSVQELRDDNARVMGAANVTG